jgi:hypothetical protein
MSTIKKMQPPKPEIVFDKKIIDRRALKIMQDTLQGKQNVSGDAIAIALKDFEKLRALCEEIAESYENGDDYQQGVKILGMIL